MITAMGGWEGYQEFQRQLIEAQYQVYLTNFMVQNHTASGAIARKARRAKRALQQTAGAQIWSLDEYQWLQDIAIEDWLVSLPFEEAEATFLSLDALVSQLGG